MGLTGFFVNGTSELLLHCGGTDEVNDLFSFGCNVFDLETNGDHVSVTSATEIASLPHPLCTACHGGDGNRFVVAGGMEALRQGDLTRNSTVAYHDGVLVLEGIGASWDLIPTTLGRSRAMQVGVFVEGKLLCLGGVEDTVGLPSWDRQLNLVQLCLRYGAERLVDLNFCYARTK